MRMNRSITKLLLIISHGGMALLGFAAGVYLLPILVQPPAPDIASVESRLSTPLFTASVARERKDSDALHWGEGELRLHRHPCF